LWQINSLPFNYANRSFEFQFFPEVELARGVNLKKAVLLIRAPTHPDDESQKREFPHAIASPGYFSYDAANKIVSSPRAEVMNG